MPFPPFPENEMNNQAAQTMPEQWPEYVMLRDTKLHDDEGGLGQRIYTTAGAGYKKVKYVRADLAALSQTAGVPLERAVADLAATVADEWLEMFAAIPGLEKYERYTYGPAVTLLREQLREMLAAAPAASGGESHPDALPDGTLSKSTAKRVEALSSNPNPVTPGLSSESGASVSERARAIEMLAQEVEKDMTACADDIRAGKLHGMADASVRAIIRAMGEQAPTQQTEPMVCPSCFWVNPKQDGEALTQQRGSEPCLYVKPRLVEILHKLGPAQTEHRVMVSTVPDAQYTVCLSTTPQPGAEALREKHDG